MASNKWIRLTQRKKTRKPSVVEECLVSNEKINIDNQTMNNIIDVLESGSELTKMRGFNRRYRRKYIVDFDNQLLFYLGSGKTYCLKPKTHINFREIHDIRRGWRTDSFNKIAKHFSGRKAFLFQNDVDESCCFSIVYGSRQKSLDLVCPDPKVCDVWVQGLAYLLAIQRGMEKEESLEAWLKRKFLDADQDRSGMLNFEEILLLIDQLNLQLDKDDALQHFHECDPYIVESERVLDVGKFIQFYRLLDERPEIKVIFDRFSGNTGLWGASELQSFLIEEENMKWISLDTARDEINEIENSYMKLQGYMTYEAFQRLLRMDKMDIYDYDHRHCVYQDMTQPLNHYYISSSHNTYLTANQLTGNSSLEGYISALKKGCRCLELDLWDGENSEPKIKHGYTLTSKIYLKDVLMDAIVPLAFETSEYPLILSVENHLSTEQQKIAAFHFKNILGDMLYLQPIASDMTKLPSPNELKFKVIIKGKKIDPNQDATDSVESRDSEDEEKEKDVCKEFSDLINICSSVSFRGFHTKNSFYEMASIQERTALKYVQASPNSIIQHSQNHLMRIYPSHIRQDSSNLNPVPFWNVGCQMVALNYQTGCEAMVYNQAKFRDNGGCGYILKPKHLRTVSSEESEDEDYDDDEDDSSNESVSKMSGSKIQLTIKVISAQRLPKIQTITDPYVIVNVKGHCDDENTVKTSVVSNNGFNPIWNETFSFPINFWELSFIHFEVWDSNTLKDFKIGELCIPCTSIQQGYRHVHLLGDQHPGSLFVHVKIENKQPDEIHEPDTTCTSEQRTTIV